MEDTRLNPHHSKYKTKKFPLFSKPFIEGCFSVDEQRNFCADRSRLQYLKLPEQLDNLSFDLNSGFHIYVPKPEKDEKIDFLLKFLLENFSRLKRNIPDISQKPFDYDFVCFRGLLRLIMCTPYEKKEGWSILATRYKNTIYLCKNDLDDEPEVQDEKSKLFCYYGFKFEQYILAPKIDEPVDTESPVIQSNEFCAMFRASLEHNKILFGGEMDGIISDKNLPNDTDLNSLEFVEVKTKRRENNYRQKENFYRFKLIKWWCQSFLVGIEKLFVGIRNDQGIVDEIQPMTTRDISHLGSDFWSPTTCLEFCSKFLNLIKYDMRNINSPFTVIKYNFNPGGNILKSNLMGVNKYTFLPKWYIDEIESHCKFIDEKVCTD